MQAEKQMRKARSLKILSCASKIKPCSLEVQSLALPFKARIRVLIKICPKRKAALQNVSRARFKYEAVSVENANPRR